MAAQQNLNLVRRLFDEVYNKENLALCDELFANNIKLFDTAANHHNEGLKAVKEQEAKYVKAFPQKKLKIDDIFEAGDKVVVRWTCQATHRGNLEDIPATNKPIKISGISIYQCANGKINAIYQNWDRLGLFEQIGEVHLTHAALHG